MIAPARTKNGMASRVNELKPLEILTAREHGAYLRACNAGDREQLRYILHLYPQAVHWHADWNGTGGTNGLGACIYAGGHTHRAATHDHIVDGIHIERWVLADWHEDCGECQAWNGETLNREALRPDSSN